MEERKWEDLNLDCLLNVFERLGLGSLVLDVPFVCKSWYKATLNPQCWRHIELPTDRLNEPGVLGIIKFAIKHNARYVVSLKTPHNYNPARKSCNSTKDLLVYIANECPFLKGFMMSPCLSPDQMCIVPSLISKWTNLEWLTLQYSSYMQEILTQVSLHCKNFVGLAITEAYFCDKEASDIATLLPNIKYLCLSYAYLHEDDLEIILRGCKELLYLDVRYCVGFEEEEDEILKLASHIPTFMCEGSREAIGGWWSRKREIYRPIDG
ncbi:putative F-box/LRR-repeat protein 23 [Cornus florida]|uniref:putative F-box/LRR-repeat protein 23 n=1 Tax=Cornus florida TaxID=4283 RepID=UPI00289C80D7|nr:putative F-box/LRR-repeat protein 23 [Cornus florida]